MANRLKQLRSPSFRGIKFEVDQDSKEFGRNVITHQYPGKDDPYHEDMGEAPQSFTIDAFINSDDFIARADSLEKALRKSGPGTLIHPLYGEIEVIVIKARRQHSSSAVGDVIFNITFEKFGGPVFPAAGTGTAAALGSSSASFLSSLSSDFTNVFSIENLPDFIAADAGARFDNLFGNLGSVLSAGGLEQYLPVALPTWKESATSIADTVRSVFAAIGSMSKKRSAPMISTNAPIARPAPALPLSTALTRISEFGTAEGGSSVRQKNARALDNLVQASALAAAAASAQNSTYESREQAIGFRERFETRMSLLSDRLGADGWDDSWQQSRKVSSAIARDISERVGRLPRTVSISTIGIRPSLELANRLYGDDPDRIVSAAADIAARNKVLHPGFVPAKKLEVLIDAAAR